MPKRMQPRQMIKKFKPLANMNSDDGWTIDYNKDVRRYDLRHEDQLHFSHVSRATCVSVAEKRFKVEMYNV